MTTIDPGEVRIEYPPTAPRLPELPVPDATALSHLWFAAAIVREHNVRQGYAADESTSPDELIRRATILASPDPEQAVRVAKALAELFHSEVDVVDWEDMGRITQDVVTAAVVNAMAGRNGER